MSKIHRKADLVLEQSTKDAVMNDAFEEMYHRRGRVYRVNFVRGVFFGLGTFVGGTIVVALLIIILSWLMSIAPDSFRDFFQWIVDTLSKRG